jgi:hypothetical protein
MNKRKLFLIAAGSLILLGACRKNNPGPPLIIVNPHEDIFYSRDTMDSKAYQMHITYNSNGSVDILRNEVGAVHADRAYDLIITGIQTFVKPDTAHVVLLSGHTYWLIPFQPGAAAVSVAAADTLMYTSACVAGSGGPCQLISQSNNAPQPFVMSVNPHGCSSNAMLIKAHSANYAFNGGSVLLEAASVNNKK